MTQTDSELVKQVIAGRKQAFEVLVKRYERPARAAAFQITKKHNDCEDAAQEAFIKAYQNLHSLKKPQRFGPWLLMIVRRCALDLHQRRKYTESIHSIEEIPNKSNPGLDFDEKQQILDQVMLLSDRDKQVDSAAVFQRP